jgi:hypothetical protein
MWPELDRGPSPFSPSAKPLLHTDSPFIARSTHRRCRADSNLLALSRPGSVPVAMRDSISSLRSVYASYRARPVVSTSSTGPRASRRGDYSHATMSWMASDIFTSLPPLPGRKM